MTPKEQLDLPPRHSLALTASRSSLCRPCCLPTRSIAEPGPVGPRAAHPLGHSGKLHGPWSSEGQVPPAGRCLQETGEFPCRPSWSSCCSYSMGATCPRPGASGHRPPPVARRARPCRDMLTFLGPTVRGERSGGSGMFARMELTARRGLSACWHKMDESCSKNSRHQTPGPSPACEPQVATEHEGDVGTESCDDGETDAGAPRGPAGTGSTASGSPALQPRFSSSLDSPRHLCSLLLPSGQRLQVEGRSYPWLSDKWALADARLPC